ncbi:glycosyltransferase [Listeria booriae]|uniref:Glycosyltransferase family 4 protein n=1 Tax=Listeria booriae TaxID=1552123 RepID=A0A7X0XYT4_9LIST|nr:glycosyltransferase [Listeria booriae]MBC1794258.1 glycosyltransferase family 4 protein [Listeria booriae]MBC1803188.1 glycosyltransferase family 4 protein [Listeria booriae]
MTALRILLYGDIDLNFMDGSAVWLTSIAPVLSLNPHIQVDLLLKAREQNDRLTCALKNKENLQLIQPFERFSRMSFQNPTRLNVQEAVGIMSQLHQENPYQLVIVRGFDLVREVMKHEAFRHITVPYLTDFKHDERSTAEEREDLKRVYDHFDHMFLQTKETKEAFKNLIQVDGEKIRLLYPMVPESDSVPSFRNKHSRLIYSGKFHEDWYTEEIISATKKLSALDSRIHTQIVGDKFQERLRERDAQLRIKKAFQDEAAIDWVGAVSREACQSLIEEADVGISWRSASLDNDDSVELSSKLLEYGRLGKPALVRKTKMHADLLGVDYPLFVNTEEDFIEKAANVLQDENLYMQAAQMMFEASKYFTFHAAYGRLKDFIWSFYKPKIKMVFAGHDLKFAKMLMEHFDAHPNFEVKTDVWSSHEKHDEKHSHACVEWADIIFCEWGLGNAVWYSQNKRPNQELIVRMHFQEKDLKFPRLMNIDQISKIIVITPYMLEEFHRIFGIPRHKMVYMDNLLDADKFDLPKKAGKEFRLGICGILPARKRVDLAVDLFERLWKTDSRYQLTIKSKHPKDVAWLMARDKEREYYQEVFDRIEQAPWKENVIFEPHGDDVNEWMSTVGYLLSPSDYEGSHVSVSEAMSSGAVPIIRDWKGADTVYPEKYIVKTMDEAVKTVTQNGFSESEMAERKQFAKNKFDRKRITREVAVLVRECLTAAK